MDQDQKGKIFEPKSVTDEDIRKCGNDEVRLASLQEKVDLYNAKASAVQQSILIDGDIILQYVLSPSVHLKNELRCQFGEEESLATRWNHALVDMNSDVDRSVVDLVIA